MSEPVTKLKICAAADGVVLDPVGRQNRAHESLQLSYGNGRIAFGIVGVLDLVACSFLIAISRREQVAQICDRPVYCVKDVAIIPLSSQAEAEEAIIAANGASELGGDYEDGERETDVEDGGETLASADSELPKSALEQSTAFAKNVLQNRGRYGRFADRWFGKAGWNENRRRSQGMSEESCIKEEEHASESASKKQDQESTVPLVDAERTVTSEGDGISDTKSATKASEMIVSLTPRILRAVKLYFSTSGFYFSYDDDISATLMQPDDSDTTTASVPLCKRFNEDYYWNKHLQHSFIDAGQYAYALPLLHGFVGQRAFCVLRDQEIGNGVVPKSPLKTESSLANPENTETLQEEEKANREELLLTLISRRSANRAGLRYLRRGADDAGHVANAVETEQILSPQSKDKKGKIFSLLQVRGSIPLFFYQSPYSFKPQPVLHGSEATNSVVLKRHLDKLTKHYENVHCACLVDKHGTEKVVGEAFERQMQLLNATQDPNQCKSGFEWFDFHAECKGMRFENVSILLDRLRSPLEAFGWSVREGDRTSKRQHGVLRTNCMDCLDRTNVVQSAVAGWALEQQLLELGLSIDLKADPKTQWFNNLWADNGDAISKQYTGTSALKGDFTRTRKRNWIGALSDLSLTLTRYYNNIFSDYFLQLNIDYFLGNVGPSAFDDFEADMTGHDNALDIQRVRADAVGLCITTVIDESKEKFIAGWTLGCPQEANTLISHPFDECVLLLTDVALHFCRIDWNAERVDKLERIGLLDILEMWKGPYVTSTLGVTHTDESTNVGFAFRYNTRNDVVIRSNERTVESEAATNEITPGAGEQVQPEEGSETRLLAFKVLSVKSSSTKITGGESTEESEQDILDKIGNELHDTMACAARGQRGVDHLELEKVPGVQNYPVVSAAEARKNTGYSESIAYSIKKLIWSLGDKRNSRALILRFQSQATYTYVQVGSLQPHPVDSAEMKRKIGALEKVDADLPNLQHKIRIDPPSYRDDFVGQYSQYASLYELFLQSPTTTDDSGIVRLRDLIDFVSHVADCYPKITQGFAGDLRALIERHHATLDPELRDKIVGSLVLLRRKDIIDSQTLLNTLWPLLISTPSKSLRALLYQKIISDIRTANSKTTNHKLNRSMQTTCHNLIASDPASPKGIWSVKLTRELWKRQVWNDAKAVSIMAAAALSEDAKVVTGGVRFFLGGDQEREEAADDESDADEDIDMGKLRHQAVINKKSAKRDRELKAAKAKVKRKEKKKNAPHPLNFSALHLLHDPQGFAEKLFFQHLQPSQPKVKLDLEQKLHVLNLVSRLVGLHKLTLIPLYSYFLKFLTPRQPSVTSFLASLAQATHNLVPPDALEPLIQKTANEFVSEASAAEVASAGLNAIREVCARQPLAMSETLLQDLVHYRKSKDKGVQMAARGLLSLYREVGAGMLRKRDRGREAALKLRSGEQDATRRFGAVEQGGIEGLELLEKWKDEQGQNGEEDEEKGWDDWDAQSDSSESSGGWINVESEGEDIDISDSEDEREKAAKKKNETENKQAENKDGKGAGADGSSSSRSGASMEPEAALKREEQRISNLATTRILTPADLAKLKELQQSAAVTASLPTAKRRRLQQAQQQQNAQRHADDAVTADDIAGLASLSHKATKEEKIAMAKGEAVGDRPAADKNDHRSSTARRKEKKAAEGKSTTNKEKARKKNMIMTLGKAKKKGKRSLTEHRNILKQHVERGKKGGRRGNR
ncbi:SDA1-domain-containing protein [Hortaea werneckii]|nr:SDA1-domain-containing protein [Hortaea werneckii]